MPKILVNYRRDDSAAYAGRLADRLREHFGRDNVFVDIDTIRPGEDFVDRIDQSIAACDALVAVIGKSWLTATDQHGHRRLEREDDYVRMEIAKALERHRRVIPALVADAAMPEAAQLPQDLVALSRKQAIEISDSRFHHDVGQLIEALSDTPGVPGHSTPTHPPSRESRAETSNTLWSLRWILGGVLTLGVALAGWVVLKPASPPHENSSTGAPPSPSASRGPAATSDATGGSGSTAPALPGSVPSGEPGAQLPEPTMEAQPAGKTGIHVVWRGSSRVPCYLFDETGTKALSPGSVWNAWRCSSDMDPWDAAPGKYQIKFGGVANTMPPLSIEVAKGQVRRVEPPVGQLRLHWNGTNRVRWYLLDRSGKRTLSPNAYNAWTCGAGKVCKADLGPGDYLLEVGAAGYEPVRVTIAAFRITDVTLP